MSMAFFFSLGMFYGLTTWLEKILGQFALTAREAGLVGGMFIFGGILGSLIIPWISDKVQRRKPFLLLCNVSALFLLYPLTSHGDINWLLIISFSMGCLFLPSYAITLQVSEEVVGEENAGAAVGLLLLAGNAGGIFSIVAMEMSKGDLNSWDNAIFLMMGFMLLSSLVVVRLSESFKVGTPEPNCLKENVASNSNLELQKQEIAIVP